MALLPRKCVRAVKLLFIVAKGIRKRLNLNKHYTQCQSSVPNLSFFSRFRLQDWRSHKEYCRKVKAAGANTFDAILFPVDETKPRLVKIPWELKRAGEDDPTTQYQDLDTDIWFKHVDKDVRALDFHRWGINGPELGRGLCFWYDDCFFLNRLPLNRCIVNATEGRAGRRWCGNILALRKSSHSYDFYENVDMKEDLKPLLTYFEEYHLAWEGYEGRNSRGA